MRNAFVKWLIDKAQADERVYLLTADLGYSVLELFQQRFENRFINVGVAEQNMVGIASGLATEGLRPYTYSIGIFPTFRCAEQIRNDIDYHGLPVVTCTVGSGVAYGNLGYSHHAIQDLSLMRSLPNMVIATPSDPSQVTMILDWHYKNPCPMYLRLHKAGEPSLRLSKQPLQLGDLIQIYPDAENSHRTYADKVCVLVVGFIADQVATLISSLAPSVPLYCVPLWGQSSLKKFVEKVEQFEMVITVEDHILEGGFGSYVMEAMSTSSKDIKVVPISFGSDIVGKVAQERTLLGSLLCRLEIELLRLASHS